MRGRPSWGRGIWNLPADEPTPIYGAVTAVNRRINGEEVGATRGGDAKAGGWGSELLRYTDFEGAFHTGWAGPSWSSWSPDEALLVTRMDDALLAGVMRDPSDDATVPR